MNRTLSICVLLLLASAVADSTIFSNLHGIVHDPEHRPIAGATVRIQATSSAWNATVLSSADGSFQLSSVPLGNYLISVSAPGFAPARWTVTLVSGASPVLHFPLKIQGATTTIEVHGEAAELNAQPSQPTMVTRQQIAQTPGANSANSLAMITDFVPSAYIVHDQLHIRGGHQVTWLVDGVPVPNTNIASNVGPQFDPKDIDTIEVQRGGYSAEYGDRTFGMFNVVTRSGFERDRQAELIAGYGGQNTTDNQLSFGDHTERFAYYASVSGNRGDLGLETPVPEAIHDQAAGLSTFASLIFNRTPADQLRLVASLRGDDYQVPNTPEQQAAGVRDVENERDAFVNFTWLHTSRNGALFTFSPFYHFNRAHYLAACNSAELCAEVVPESDRSSNYGGGVITAALTKGRHNFRVGLSGFAQHDNVLLGLESTNTTLRQGSLVWGGVAAVFLEDQYKPTRWLTLSGGVRLTHFSGVLSENGADPRIGAAITLPRINWVLRAFYGRYYQPPPLLSPSGPLLELAAQQGFAFLPLQGERDEQHEFGVAVPFSGWTAEISNFQTNIRNFFDHDVLGNSNIFFPVTISRARIRGWEMALRSPRIGNVLTIRVAYARQTVQGQGAVNGGLTGFEPPETVWYFLDHDQRHTLSTVVHADLPRRIWASGTVAYGSGFLDGDGPGHLPAHTTLDLAFGKSFGESLTLQLSALNLTNRRYLIDNSNTFGGTHWANPRRISMELRWKFRY